MFVFDADQKQWSELKLSAWIPKPRRRGSAVFVASSLLLFGGFDGDFFNDLQVLHLNEASRKACPVSPSSLDKDFLKQINNPHNNDLRIIIEQNIMQKSTDQQLQDSAVFEVSVCKYLLIRWIYEKELDFVT